MSGVAVLLRIHTEPSVVTTLVRMMTYATTLRKTSPRVSPTLRAKIARVAWVTPWAERRVMADLLFPRGEPSVEASTDIARDPRRMATRIDAKARFSTIR